MKQSGLEWALELFPVMVRLRVATDADEGIIFDTDEAKTMRKCLELLARET